MAASLAHRNKFHWACGTDLNMKRQRLQIKNICKTEMIACDDCSLEGQEPVLIKRAGSLQQHRESIVPLRSNRCEPTKPINDSQKTILYLRHFGWIENRIKILVSGEIGRSRQSSAPLRSIHVIAIQVDIVLVETSAVSEAVRIDGVHKDRGDLWLSSRFENQATQRCNLNGTTSKAFYTVYTTGMNKDWSIGIGSFEDRNVHSITDVGFGIGVHNDFMTLSLELRC
jgi:hypothetical protein